MNRIAREWLELQKPQLKPASFSSYTNIVNSYLMIACALGLSLLLFGCASTKQQSQVDYIGAEAAKTLEHVGLTADQVTFVKIKLENENGRQLYDVEFYTSSRLEYEFEIDGYSGAICEWEADQSHDSENHR